MVALGFYVDKKCRAASLATLQTAGFIVRQVKFIDTTPPSEFEERWIVYLSWEVDGLPLANSDECYGAWEENDFQKRHKQLPFDVEVVRGVLEQKNV